MQPIVRLPAIMKLENNIKTHDNPMDFIEELTWRGMIHQMMPGTD